MSSLRFFIPIFLLPKLIILVVKIIIIYVAANYKLRKKCKCKFKDKEEECVFLAVLQCICRFKLNLK